MRSLKTLKRAALHSIFVSALITLSMATMMLGARPAEAAPFAYVTNAGDGTVSVISTATNAVVATIPVGNTPHGVAITPNGKFVYVANRANPSVSVIATATNAVVTTIVFPFGGDTEDVVITPDGKLA
jgi:YVTN family beta-propeller protein